jgi:hypothetical protein
MKILEKAQDLQEKARQFWMTLNMREKILLSIIAGFMSVLVVAAVVKQGAGLVFERASQAEQTVQNIGKIERLAKKLIQQRGPLLRYERLRAKRGDNFDAISFIKTQASKFGAEVKKVSPTRPKEASEENLEWIELQLGGQTSLSAAMKLLESIEEPLGVRIVELSIKPQFSKKSQLEVTALITNAKEL